MSTQTVAEKTSQGSRRPLLIGLAVLAVLISVSVLTRDDADVEDPFDPRNPTASGDQAVARVLDQHGVDVVIARGQAALLAEQVDPETAVVVTNPDQPEWSNTVVTQLVAGKSLTSLLPPLGDSLAKAAQAAGYTVNRQ